MRRRASNARGTWRLGRPAVTLQMPSAFNLPAGQAEDTQEFVLETARDRGSVHHGRRPPARQPRDCARRDRLRPRRGPHTRDRAGHLAARGHAGAHRRRHRLPVAGRGTIGRADPLRKTWKLENKAASDRSTVGLYLSNAPVRDVRRLDLTAAGAVLEEDAQALAVVALRNPGAPADVDVRIEAVRPDGSRVPDRRIRRPSGMGSALLACASAHAAERHTPRREDDSVPRSHSLRISLDIVRAERGVRHASMRPWQPVRSAWVSCKRATGALAACGLASAKRSSPLSSARLSASRSVTRSKSRPVAPLVLAAAALGAVLASAVRQATSPRI